MNKKFSHRYYKQASLYRHYTKGETLSVEGVTFLILDVEFAGGWWHVDMVEV